ncbi:kanamycin kinase [Streptomyces yokosukanensis]|uniref:Kanamycin kinase n=1 Tax=Streptomyces yokosukanensis TaxID=67386 RepID=A0A124HF72_9ACTN|nr:ROK family protein [Streptomyces yokosukanensis]KUN02984.1 kanamycin kinase [Streptomyces yokosukanensis]
MEAAIRYHLGIDVGGTKVALRAEHEDGTVRETGFRWPPAADSRPADAAADLALLVGHVREMSADAAGEPCGVGVAMPATLDASGVVTAWPNRPGWVGTDLVGVLGTLFGTTRVVCADDGDLAALAEARAASRADLLYLGVGTGVGGGIVLDGRLLPGPSRGSCEIGHLVVDRAGERCDCGRRGCVQSVASGPAVLRRAARARGAEVSFADLARALADGVPWAADAVREGCAALATAAVGVSELLRTRLVVIGGGFAAGLPGFTATVAAEVARLARPGHPLPPVEPARLQGLSSLRGAVLLAKESHV